MDLVSTLQTFSDGSIKKKSSDPFVRKDIDLVVPTNGKRFVRIKGDSEILGYPRGYADGKAYPAVVTSDRETWGLLTKYADQVYSYVPIPDIWAKFFWDLLDWASDYRLPTGKIERFYTKSTNSGLYAYATPGTLMWVYINLIEKSRSHTDSFAPEVGARDIMTGRNLDSDRNWEWLFRPTTGQLGMIRVDRGNYWELEALDVLKPPPSIEIIKNSPWLFGWATEQTTVGIPPLPYKKWVVSNYPQIEVAFREHNLPVTGTPIPFISKGGNVWIKKSSCVELIPGTRWSPYLPEK